MRILVFNCGSSSLTFKLFDARDGGRLEELLRGKANRVGVIGDRSASLELLQEGRKTVEEMRINNHCQAAGLVLEALQERDLAVEAIGHRWAHSGGRFTTAFVDADLLRLLRTLVPLIPIHHPAMLRVIEACRRRYPEVPQYVTTDTAFHSTLPEQAYGYALPRSLIEEHGFRKYGFHGLSFRYVTEKVLGELQPRRGGARLVICHLGTGGSEIAAIRDGRSVDVSMGYTGLTGLMMSTRCGDIDPLAPAYVSRLFGLPLDGLGRMLNRQSGLLGVTGATADIRDVLERCRSAGEKQAQLALAMYVRSIRRYIGGFVAALQGLDALVFTDDIGARNAAIREQVCRGLEWCGIRLEPRRNLQATGECCCRIEAPDSAADILIVPTDEEEVIAREGLELLGAELPCA